MLLNTSTATAVSDQQSISPQPNQKSSFRDSFRKNLRGSQSHRRAQFYFHSPTSTPSIEPTVTQSTLLLTYSPVAPTASPSIVVQNVYNGSPVEINEPINGLPCADNNVFLSFYVEQLKESHNCDWLAENPGWNPILCRIYETPYVLCPRTCGRCAD